MERRSRMGERVTRRPAAGLVLVAAAVVLVVSLAAPAPAIVYGELDGERHPNVGTMVFESEPGVFQKHCSGTLISPTVYLTASHCTASLANRFGVAPDEVFVTFDATFDQASPLVPGTYHTNPKFSFSGPGGMSDPHDIAVVVLDHPVGITPARLPARGLLDEMKAAHQLKEQDFTAVGYGAIRETNRQAFQEVDRTNADRRFAVQGFLSLEPAWLNLPMNLATDNGGTCFGDSGGPHFLGAGEGETDVVVSITIIGDLWCKATDKTYRTDTGSARAFLSQFVALP